MNEFLTSRLRFVPLLITFKKKKKNNNSLPRAKIKQSVISQILNLKYLIRMHGFFHVFPVYSYICHVIAFLCFGFILK